MILALGSYVIDCGSKLEQRLPVGSGGEELDVWRLFEIINRGTTPRAYRFKWTIGRSCS